MSKRHLLLIAIVTALSVAAAGRASAEVLYGVTHDETSPYTSHLITFDSAAPGSVLTSVLLTGGSTSNDTLLGGANQFTITGIDFIQSTGQLYGVANRSGFAQRIYSINPATGSSTYLSSTFVSGGSWGWDYNAANSRFRLSSDNSSGNNYHFDPNVVVTTTDTSFAYAAGDPNFGVTPRVESVAYTNLPAANTLYGIDSQTDSLVRIGSVGGSPDSAESGKLTTVGPLTNLTLTPLNPVGMEISANTGLAYATANLAGLAHLFSINLVTGTAADLGQIGSGATVYDLATIAVPEAAGFWCVSLIGALTLATARLRRLAARA
jgi:hypothetical protein